METHGADFAEPLTNRSGPLSHIRILDLGRIMAAPWATQIFADLGADVIKIERPGVGDDTRNWGPPFLKDDDGNFTKESGYFLSVNRGKRSVTVDLSSSHGQSVIRALAATSDVVIENFKVGALKKYGLDAETLRKINPRLIYCSVTGYGQDGPRAEEAAYDFAIQAMGGLMSVTGEKDDLPGGGPQKVGVPVVDLMTGMYAAVGILAAIASREHTGKGDTIDLAMLDVSAALLANQAMNHLASGAIPQRNGNRHPNIQPQDVFACADGHFVLAVGNDQQFVKLCEAIDEPALAHDPRFVTNSDRVSSEHLLTPILNKAFGRYARNDLVEKLSAFGVPCAPINTIPELFSEPQIKHREMLRKIRHPQTQELPQVVSPLNFSENPLRFDRPPPMLGEHTEEVLADLAMTKEKQ